MLICLILPIYINNWLLDRDNHIKKHFLSTIDVFVGNKTSTNSNADCKDHCN